MNVPGKINKLNVMPSAHHLASGNGQERTERNTVAGMIEGAHDLSKGRNRTADGLGVNSA